MNVNSIGHVRPLLVATDVDVSYGQIAAVRNASIVVGTHEIVSLVGSNGAGKSSLINSICRLRSCGDKARITLNDLDITALRADELPSLGLVQVPEGRRVFARLTVEENLVLGAFCRAVSRSELRSDLERIYDIFPRLRERRMQASGSLSGGEQQMLAIGRALMATPKLLLLDEPSMGLAPRVIDTIYAAIKTIAEYGVSLLIVEQNAFLALEMSSRAYVMEAGEITLSGPAAELIKDDKLREAYLG